MTARRGASGRSLGAMLVGVLLSVSCGASDDSAQTQSDVAPTDATDTPDTTTTSRTGTSDNPFDLRTDADPVPDVLTKKGYLSSIMMYAPVDIATALILESNELNNAPPDGMKYVDVLFDYTVDEDYAGLMMMGATLLNYCELVGSKGQPYEALLLQPDWEDTLSLLDSEDSVVGGGSLTGSVMYIVDIDDRDWKLACDGWYIIPAERP